MLQSVASCRIVCARQMTPKPEMDAEAVDELEAEMDAFEDKCDRDIKYPQDMLRVVLEEMTEEDVGV